MRKENLTIGLLLIIAIALVAIAVEPMFTPHALPRRNPRLIRFTLSLALSCCGRPMAASRSMARWWWTCATARSGDSQHLHPSPTLPLDCRTSCRLPSPFELGKFAFEDIDK